MPLSRISRSLAALAMGLTASAFATVAPSARADGDKPGDDELRTTPASGAVSVIEAVGGFGGGNVAVSIGADGVLLVDAMSHGIAPKLAEELRSMTDKPVRVVIDTHFHLDHAGGNADLGRTATIVARDTVRHRLEGARMPAPGLPVVTYAAGSAPAIHFNGEDIRLLTCPSGAHSDGDTVVVFESSRVVHLGDLFFSGMFPAVYTEGGGDWRGLIACLHGIVPQLPAGAVVVGGHGPVSDVAGLKAYVQMLDDATAIVQAHLARGESAQDIERQNVLARYDALGSGGAQTTPQFVQMLVKLLSPPRATPPH
jgi:cyclase